MAGGLNIFGIYSGLSRTDPAGMCPQQNWGQPAPPTTKPKMPCNGKITKVTLPVFEFCNTMCNVGLILVKDPSDICGYCKKFGGQNPARTMCDWLCKKSKLNDAPNAKKAFCNWGCCQGTLPNGVPGAKCFSDMLKGGHPVGGRRILGCEWCCKKTFPNNNSAATHCTTTCQRLAKGK